jgi:2,6-dihydroxypyridine 3-monooxygenase
VRYIASQGVFGLYMGAKLRVGIVGGSLGGLNAALWLRDIGCDVSIYERAAQPLTGLGAGIVLNPATVRWFRERGGPALDDISVASQRVRYVDYRGDVIVERDDGYRFSSYNALYRGMLDAFGMERYRLGRTVASSSQNPNAATAYFADESTAQLDLLVCADGVHSHYLGAQSRIAPELAPRYAGYVAWRGIARPADVDTALFNTLFNAITYHVMPRGHMLVYPIPVVDRDGADSLPCLNWLWYRNVAAGAELDALMTDRDGVRRELSLGPGAVRDEHVLALWADADEHLPHDLAALVTRTAQPFVQVIVDRDPLRMAHNRICVIGDAAFVARPHAAAGTAKAADDGYQLAQALLAHEFDVRAALRAWEASQLKLGQSVLARARGAGERLQVESSWEVGAPLPFGLYRDGDSIM